MGRYKKINLEPNMSPLTMDDIPNIIGKRIEILYFSLNGVEKDTLIVGGLETRFNLAKKEDLGNGFNRAEMWERTMTPCQLENAKTTMHIVNEKGCDTFIFAKKNVFFTKDKFHQVYFCLCD